MKIGIDIRLIGKKRTGDEVVIFNLVKNFAKINTKDEFILLTDNCNEEELTVIKKQLEIEQSSNFKIVSLECKNRFAWNFWTLPNYLRNNPVDVYHTQYITPWFVSKKIKIVTIIHDVSFNVFPQFIKLSDLLFLKTLIPISIKRADIVVGVSKFTHDEIISYYKLSSEKVEWIHNSIDESFLNQQLTDDELEAVRKKYNLPQNFILYIGTLQPRKNVPHLIEAYARIKEKVGDLKLVICGNRNAYNVDVRINESLEKLSISNDVIFPGFIDEKDKVAVYRLAKVFAFPSLYEGFGIPVLEAMSQNVPVLCSNIPSLMEVADNAAVFFEKDSLDDFSQKLYNISVDENLRAKLIQAGKARIGFFSWEKSAQKMLAIYRRISNN